MDGLEALFMNCAALSIKKAARLIAQIYNRALKPSGLRITQLAILTSAARLDSPTVTRMARDLGMDRTTLSRGLRPLVREGLLCVVSGSDRRTKHVEITRQGEARIESALPAWQAAQAEIAARIGPKEFEATLTRVAALTERLTRLGPDGREGKGG